jgi:hypothetical protein
MAELVAGSNCFSQMAQRIMDYGRQYVSRCGGSDSTMFNAKTPRAQRRKEGQKLVRSAAFAPLGSLSLGVEK